MKTECWSSVQYGAFMRAWAREMGNLGYETALRWQVDERDYRQAKTRWQRLRMRWRCYISYPLNLLLRCRSGPARISIVTSNTFYAPGLVALTCAKGVTPVHLVYDLFPDALEADGAWRQNGLTSKLVRRWQRMTFEKSALNVFLGEHLLAHAERTHGKIPRTVIIPVGAEGAFFENYPPQPRASGHRTVLYYGGNLGRMHDLETVLGAWTLPGPPDASFRWRFQGNGVGFARLEALAAKNLLPANVSLGGNLPDAEWTQAMLDADIALVTMRPGAERVVMPSKTYSALVAGQAILAIAPRDSDLAELVTRHNCGWVIEPEALARGRADSGVAGLRSLLARLANAPDEIYAKRLNAFRAGHEHYSMPAVAKTWGAALKTLAPG